MRPPRSARSPRCVPVSDSTHSQPSFQSRRQLFPQCSAALSAWSLRGPLKGPLAAEAERAERTRRFRNGDGGWGEGGGGKGLRPSRSAVASTRFRSFISLFWKEAALGRTRANASEKRSLAASSMQPSDRLTLLPPASTGAEARAQLCCPPRPLTRAPSPPGPVRGPAQRLELG